MSSTLLCIVIVSSICLTVSLATECPDDWTYNAATKACYYVQNITAPNGTITNFFNNTAAEEECQGMGAHLASIHSDDENDFVRGLIPSDGTCNAYWIGYEGNGTLGTGSWTDGSVDDYFGGFDAGGVYFWMMANDDVCPDIWFPQGPGVGIPGFICKQPAVLQCPDGWAYIRQLESCYYLQNLTPAPGVSWIPYNFTAAEALCQGMGAHLASIHSDAENDLVRGLIPTVNANFCYTYWIGYEGNGTLGTGNWTDGSIDDYFKGYNSGVNYFWMLGDDGCSDEWYSGTSGGNAPGFICEQPATS